MSGEILITIIAILSIFGFMYRQTALMSAETKEFRAEMKEFRAEVHGEFKEVRAEIAAVNERLSADIAAVDKRLSHTDGLVEGLSRALLSTQAPAQTLPQTQAQA